VAHNHDDAAQQKHETAAIIPVNVSLGRFIGASHNGTSRTCRRHDRIIPIWHEKASAS
jgi:hypothetical protein